MGRCVSYNGRKAEENIKEKRKIGWKAVKSAVLSYVTYNRRFYLGHMIGCLFMLYCGSVESAT